MRKVSSILFGIFSSAVAFGQGLGWGATVPVDSTFSNEGNSALAQPFNAFSSRFQQVYRASEFPQISTNTGVGFIDRIYFRTDGPTGFRFAGTISNLEIRISTTTKGPDSLSPVFNENVGPNETLVFGPINQFMSGNHVPSGTTAQSYDVILFLTTPFLYRPADGNLLVDFRVTGGQHAILDGWNRVGDSVGSVAGRVGDLSGSVTTVGLATLFGGTLVPEPSAYALLALAGTTFFLLRKRKRT